MSYLSEEFVQCETLQTKIDDQFMICPPSEAMPVLEFIIEAQKASGISQSVSDAGKVKNIKVVYDQRILESEVDETSGSRTCTSDTARKNNYTNYTIDPAVFLRADDSFTTAELATTCVDDVQSLLAKKIFAIVDVLDRKVATKTMTELVALYGDWGSNVSGVTNDELVVTTLISEATKAVDYTAMADIDLALMQTGYCAPRLIAGGSKMYQYGKALNAGCCSVQGVDLLSMANQFGQSYSYDKRLASALGSELKSMVIQAGSVALIKYNESTQVPNLGANYAKILVYSPRTGLPYDIVMKDDCGTIHIVGYATTKLVGLPTDMFAVGDEYRGVTFVNKILVTNPA